MLRKPKAFYDKKLENVDAAQMTEILVNSEIAEEVATEIKEVINQGDLDEARLKLSDWLTENQPAG